MVRKALALTRNHLYNINGKSLSRNIIVFESDDWGTIRMPSRGVYQKLTDAGVALHKNPYNRYDSLETPEDLESLFEVLRKFRDAHGNHPVITANFIVGNPDFDKIADTNFEKYTYNRFTETYKQQTATENSFDSVKQGISENLIKPQFHGREHVNVNQWLALLRSNHSEVLKAFNERVFCLDVTDRTVLRSNLMAAFDYNSPEEKKFVTESIADGLNLFEETFGFKSKSMIAPCNVWGDDAENVAAMNGVKYIQGLRGRLIPQAGASDYKKAFPVPGSQNAQGQYYSVRNAYFEPATIANYDWVGNTMSKIAAAFFWGKPAVISTHRLNYIGSLDEANRKNTLRLFSELLSKIVAKWPEAEFISSDQLGQFYK